MTAEGPITAFTAAVERAVRNNQRAHLDPGLLRAVIESDAYAMLLDARRKELVASWEDETPAPAPQEGKAGSKSENSGSNGEQNASSGASPGTIPSLVHDAAERRALEAAAQLIPQKKHGRRLPSIISKRAGRPSQSPPPKRRSQTS